MPNSKIYSDKELIEKRIKICPWARSEREIGTDQNKRKITFTDAQIKIRKIHFGDTSDIYISQRHKIHFGHTQSHQGYPENYWCWSVYIPSAHAERAYETVEVFIQNECMPDPSSANETKMYVRDPTKYLQKPYPITSLHQNRGWPNFDPPSAYQNLWHQYLYRWAKYCPLHPNKTCPLSEVV